MKAGDVSGCQAFSRESWLSTPLSDPNAALWASITPPANPNLATIVRRRAAKFSLDLVAQHLFLRFPARFSSRSTARTAILAAAVVFGAALGAIGFLALGPRLLPAAASAAISEARAVPASTPAASLSRIGQTELAASAPTLAITARSDAATQTARSDAPRVSVQSLMPSVAASDAVATPAKAKLAASKKRVKATARRASKRRARTPLD